MRKTLIKEQKNVLNFIKYVIENPGYGLAPPSEDPLKKGFITDYDKLWKKFPEFRDENILEKYRIYTYHCLWYDDKDDNQEHNELYIWIPKILCTYAKILNTPLKVNFDKILKELK